MKKVAILQSNYIPWKGYFDLIAAVDEFILYDDMQYTRRDWRNRNIIKTPQGLHWLTVPVKAKGKFEQTIRDTEIDGYKWREQHWKTLISNYRKSAHFSDVAEIIEPLYQASYRTISEVNLAFIKAVCNYLGIITKISNSWDYHLINGKTERLVNLCQQANATEYISGPAAKEYIEPEYFEAAEISLSWFDYQGYREYPQLWGYFVHGVTILDLMFNCGKDAPNYMRYVKK
ncbi:WbqC family protein [Methylomonas rapida]|uniref:WbqC family protein n=1 Tax=Methylomonas rapida TaxID=2963939 RepID=A0ABY7GFQ9_9GAMM|nr:WbqC family protein [Methylomonas rapida]WAR44079.1 WbqC family protein [Methylomonas rapida]